jgi:uncharacterized protein
VPSRARDVDGAVTYARTRLAEELPGWLRYHDLAHTEALVVPSAQRLAADLGVTGRDLELLVTAAWFHDLGFIVRYERNEDDAIAIAAEALPGFGYSPEDVAIVVDIIGATRLPQQPSTLLQEIMCDADLFVLGTDHFTEREQRLRAELAQVGETYTDVAWWRYQETFVENHRYFTHAARAANDATKADNLRVLRERLREAAVTGLS